MKTIANIYLVFILFPFGSLIGQDETISIEFAEATPNWVHTIVDSTFEEISGQPYWTKYSSLTPGPIKRINNELLLLSNSKEAGSLLDDYGFVLDKIDISTGELLWKHHNTMYADGNQDFYHEINVRSDGDIELVGVERFGENNGSLNWSFGAYNSNSIRKIIDISDGNLIQSIHAVDSILDHNFPCRSFRQFPINGDSLYLTALMIGEDVGQTGSPSYNYGVTFQLMDKNMNNLEVSRNLFDFEDLGPFSIDQPSYMLRLEENILVSMAFKDRYESWDNQGLKMMWSDISDPYNIRIKQIIDYKDIVPGTKENFLNLRFKTLNNTIFLGHRYPNFDIQENSAYILWLNSEGAIKSFIDLPKYNDHLYQFTDMIYANDNYAYLFAFPSNSGRVGFDIIRINNGVDTIQYISSITAKNEGEEFGTQINAVFEDGYVIFGGLTKKEGQGTKTAVKYYCFSAESLGMDFEPVSTTEMSKADLDFQIYPNPTTDHLFIDCRGCSNDYKIHLINQFGVILRPSEILKFGQINDISYLPNGMYYVQVLNSNNRIITTKKIGKVD